MTQKAKRLLGYLPQGTGQIFPFNSLFKAGAVDVVHQGIQGVDAIILWGGTDIHPSYYGESAHKYNQVYQQPRPSVRDQNEWKAMIYAKAHNIPIIGVCRGAQFLCAFAGGKLIQHVNGHHQGNDTHPILCKDDGKTIYLNTTSCHHQMMYPFDVQHEMLGWVEDPLSNFYESGPRSTGLDMRDKPEPEVVWFPGVKGFAIQGHPEWMAKDDRFVQWLLKSIAKYCFNEQPVLALPAPSIGTDEYAETTCLI